MNGITAHALSFTYGDRVALQNVSFSIPAGTFAGVLGPNGGGKTTLFRILSTAVRPSAGRASIAGKDVVREEDSVRRSIGVVFQSSTSDRELTVRENLVHQGHLYGLYGTHLKSRIRTVAEYLGVKDHLDRRVGTLSGGFRRRVDLARALLHDPQVLLLDEPTAGLDPGIRSEFWTFLYQLNRSRRLTALFTTHILDEAERADHLILLAEGKVVCQGGPTDLKRRVGPEILVLRTSDPQRLQEELRRLYRLEAMVVAGTVRVDHPHAHDLVAELVHEFSEIIQSATVAQPTLEDVFIRETGSTLEGDRTRHPDEGYSQGAERYN